MMRWIFLGLGLLALALGLWWVSLHPARLILDAFGYQVEMPLWIALGAILLVFLPGTYILKGLTWILHFPSRFREYQQRQAQERRIAAYEDLLEAQILKNPQQTRAALKALDDNHQETLSFLYQLTAADWRTVDEALETKLRALLQEERWRPAAYYLLAAICSQRHMTHEALALAETGCALAPQALALQKLRLEVLVSLGRMQEVGQSVLKLLKSQKNISQEMSDFLAPVLVRHAENLAAQGRSQEAQEFLEDVYGYLSTSAAIISALAPYLVQDKQHRRVRRMAEHAWEYAPRAELARIYASGFEGLTPGERLQKIQELVARQPSHPESLKAVFEEAIDAHIFGIAHDVLQQLQSHLDHSQLLALEARLVLAQHKDAQKAVKLLQAALSTAER